jgi:NTE family protein
MFTDRLNDMKPIRVALSGSGFKFPAHVGALLAIKDAGYEPVEYAGTSGGAIIAALAASGMSLNTMTDLAMSQDWSDMLTFNPWSLLTKMSYCSGTALHEWLDEHTGSTTFSRLAVGLKIIASDVSTGTSFIFSNIATPEMTIAEAAMASAAIPFVYAPVQYKSAFLVDGGCVNNIPVDRLITDSVPRIGIQLLSHTTPMEPGTYTVFSIAPRIIAMMLAANDNAHISTAILQNAKIAFVETGYASGLNRSMSQDTRKRLLNDGYSKTKTALSS